MYLGKMPKHTRQKKGRLEIRNIGLHEGGLYICQVIGKKLLYINSAKHISVSQKNYFLFFSPGHSNEKGAEEIAQVDVMKYHH